MAHRVEISVNADTRQAVQSVNELSEALKRLVSNAGTYGGGKSTGGTTGGGTTNGASPNPYINERIQFYGQRALSFGLLMAGYSMKQFASYMDQLNNAVMNGATKFGQAMTRIVGVTNMSSSQRANLTQQLLGQGGFLPAYQTLQGVYPFATRNYPMKYAPEIAKAAGTLAFMTGSDAQTIGNLLATALEQSTRNMSYQERRTNFSKDFQQLLDLLAYSWSKSPIEPQSVMKAATYALPAMLTGGLTPNEGYALFATMLGAMPEGGRVGRYARTALTNMVTMSPEQQAKLEQLTGLTSQQLDWTKGLSQALTNIADALKNQPKSVQMEAAKEIFGLRGLSSGLDLIKNLQELSMYIKAFNPQNVKGAFAKQEEAAKQTPYGQYISAMTKLENTLTSLNSTFMDINKKMANMETRLLGAFKLLPKYAQNMLVFGGKVAGVTGEITQQIASLALTVASILFVLKTERVSTGLSNLKNLGPGALVGVGTSAMGTLGAIAAAGSVSLLGWTIGQAIGNYIVSKNPGGIFKGNGILPSVSEAIKESKAKDFAISAKYAEPDQTKMVKNWLTMLLEAQKAGKNDLYLQKDKKSEYVVLPSYAPSGQSAYPITLKNVDEMAKAIAGDLALGTLKINTATIKGDTAMLKMLLKKINKNTEETAGNTGKLAEDKATSKLDEMLKSFMSDSKLSFSEIVKLQAEMTKEHQKDLTFSASQLNPIVSHSTKVPPPFTPGSPIQYAKPSDWDIPLSMKKALAAVGTKIVEATKNATQTYSATPETIIPSRLKQPTQIPTPALAPTTVQDKAAMSINNAAMQLNSTARLLKAATPAISINLVGGF